MVKGLGFTLPSATGCGGFNGWNVGHDVVDFAGGNSRSSTPNPLTPHAEPYVPKLYAPKP
jgi:hypothetical protein